MTLGPLNERTSFDQSLHPGRTLLLPVGSFEQHGAHLPLSTDSIIAHTVASDAAAVRDVDVAPTLAYSASGEHAGFAGLLSLGTDVCAHVLTELVRSARATWSRVILVVGHGGNAECVARVLRVARHEGDNVVAWFATDPEGDPHAGASETSFFLATNPRLVAMGRVGDPVELATNWRERAEREGVRAVSPSGVLGDPTIATASRGEELRQRWCAEVVAMIDRTSESQ